eukprot:evm.model.scf_444.4 EVM.evm.TU.scf_444.4   scf_444:29732-31101(+)
MSGAPVIDCGPLLRGEDANTAAAAEVVRQIGLACRQWGFFQIVNHGVPEDLLVSFDAQTRAFFDAPRGVRAAIMRSPDNPRGYFDHEFTKRVRDWKEGFEFGRPGRHEVDGENRWPDADALPGFPDTMTRYFDAVTGLAAALMAAMARSLGLEPRTFERVLGEMHSSYARLNYFPACPNPEKHYGISHHKDAGMLTVLRQDNVGGLQVEKGGEWVDIPPIEGAYVINVGDMMQIFSNDEIRSPNHRVLAPRGRKRYSAPYFYNPAYDTVCAPLGGLVRPDRPAVYRPCRWGEFRGKRVAGNLRDLGVEVQIEHYRIGGVRGCLLSG